jgi:hypothetical protein
MRESVNLMVSVVALTGGIISLALL